MKAKVAMISGPALGHVVRLRSIADILINLDVEVEFFVPKMSILTKKVLNDYVVHNFDVEGEDKAVIFGMGVNEKLIKCDFSLIIYDANPMLWLLYIDTLCLPTICVTNVFLTKVSSNFKIVQDDFFLNNKVTINIQRQALGLSPLKTARDIYEASLTLLADPKPVVEHVCSLLPNSYKQVGECSLSFDAEELLCSQDKLNNILLLSMGSTGPGDIDEKFFINLFNTVKADTVVYVGNKIDYYKNKLKIEHCYTFIPLEKIYKQVKLIVTQGGVGSTYQALKNGLPIIVCHEHQNQNILGLILSDLGCAFNYDKNNIDNIFTSERINIMRNNAVSISHSMSLDNGPVTAASLILELLSKKMISFPITSSKYNNENAAQDVDVVFHIGLHKTGTTWLQKGLFIEHPDLLLLNSSSQPWNCPLISLLVGENERGYKHKKADRALSELININGSQTRGKVNVISAERLSGHPYSGGFDTFLIAKRIKKLCPDAKIIIGLRNPKDIIVSIFKQMVSEGFVGNFDTFIATKAWKRPFFDLSYLEYHHIVFLYRRLFGSENVKVVFYETLRDSPQNYIDDICNFLKVVSFTPKNIIKAVNSSSKFDINKQYAINMTRLSEFNQHPLPINTPPSIIQDALKSLSLIDFTVNLDSIDWSHVDRSCSILFNELGMSNPYS
ncbi:sulfotransferase domain-containing protein [Shewanella ulleungensis]|uniref:Sulfotransferase domain-containing protein n=1 Tax=Shewanella ulleungensis TaxID=2282699 RepID=A0ABQ2QJS9_9GAMM|nr:sulfotransferase domain-containing protein [Shewanella ulleungensis]MCL1149839.1 sulfotransferase [Shewanella ulleungensis]GGP84951.1 hypothetical protein GCM10009410_17630 [Shewanella ulleungensis]